MRKSTARPQTPGAIPADTQRERILRFLYERHKSARGPTKIPIGIRDLQAEMKRQHDMKQQEVSSNLDYFVQVGWVREVLRERSFKTAKGMEVSQEQRKYKISDVGIHHLEAEAMFKEPEATSHVNITNIKGVTVVGDGNVVNTQFTDLSRALDELDRAIDLSRELSDEQKLDAAGDLSTIRTQIAKKNPNPGVIRTAWQSLEAFATVSGIADALSRARDLLGGIL